MKEKKRKKRRRESKKVRTKEAVIESTNYNISITSSRAVQMGRIAL
jgi:hypothetical protein